MKQNMLISLYESQYIFEKLCSNVKFVENTFGLRPDNPIHDKLFKVRLGRTFLYVI